MKQKNLKFNNFLIQNFDKNPSDFSLFFNHYQKDNPQYSFQNLDLLFLHAFEKKQIHHLYTLCITLSNKSFLPFGILHSSLKKNFTYLHQSIQIIESLLEHKIITKENIMYQLNKLPNENLYSLWFHYNEESFLPILQNLYLQQNPQNSTKFIIQNIQPLLNSYFLNPQISYQKKIENEIKYIYQQLMILNPKTIQILNNFQNPLLSKIILDEKLSTFNISAKQKI